MTKPKPISAADVPSLSPEEEIALRRRHAFDVKVAAWRRRKADEADPETTGARRGELDAVTFDEEWRQALDIVTSPVPHVCCLREKLALVHYFVAGRGEEMDEYDRLALVGIGAVIADLCQLGH